MQRRVMQKRPCFDAVQWDGTLRPFTERGITGTVDEGGTLTIGNFTVPMNSWAIFARDAPLSDPPTTVVTNAVFNATYEDCSE